MFLSLFPAANGSASRGRRSRLYEDTIGVGQIADDFADWRRQFSHERWHGQNPVLPRALRIFTQINIILVRRLNSRESGLSTI
jgi:hypothetical protein